VLAARAEADLSGRQLEDVRPAVRIDDPVSAEMSRIRLAVVAVADEAVAGPPVGGERDSLQPPAAATKRDVGGRHPAIVAGVTILAARACRYAPDMTKLRMLPLVLLVLLGGPASAQITTERLISGLNAPIFVASPPGDPRIFVVERAGLIRIWDGDEILEPAFLDITADVNDDGEGGLLGLAFAPDYATSRAFYVYYTADGNGGNPLESRISRFRAEAGNPNHANPTEKVLLRVDQPFDNHNGGTIAFGADDLLYMAFGDGGDANDPQDNAQDGTTLLGKMIRIDVAFSDFDDDYTIPPGNPFASPSDDIRDEIWSFGGGEPYSVGYGPTVG
jgi:glucose/arabinose dehydrogenase